MECSDYSPRLESIAVTMSFGMNDFAMILTTVVVAAATWQYQSLASSWCRYVYHMDTDTWSFCDPIAWGLTKGLDETSDKALC